MLNTQEMRRLVRFIAAPTIRQAQERDAAKLMRYVTRIADEPVNNTSLRHGMIPTTVLGYRDMIRETYARGNGVMFVADADDRLAGLGWLTGGTLHIDEHDAEFHLNVDRDYRGMGLGSTLIDQTLSWARDNTMLRRVHLYVLSRNTDVIHLYRRHGFKPEGLIRDAFYLYDEGTYTDALLMAQLVK